MEITEFLEGVFGIGRELLARSIAYANGIEVNEELRLYIAANAPQILIVFLSGLLVFLGLYCFVSSLIDWFLERREARGSLANREILFHSSKFENP